MKSSVALFLLFVSRVLHVEASPHHHEIMKRASFNASGPAAFFLAGDSTTAPGGGWGDGFISTTLYNGSWGINYAVGGSTTASFIDGGSWANVLASTTNASQESYTPFVTIQFGHNDQKSTSGLTVEAYTANLERMATDVKNAGGTPILVTSLTRRTFNTTTNTVIEDLAVQANATIHAANVTDSYYIDLNRVSTNYINVVGKSLAATYNLVSSDYTHLNNNSEVLFGNMVSMLIDEAIPSEGDFSISTYTSPNATISEATTDGEYILPSEFGDLVSSRAP